MLTDKKIFDIMHNQLNNPILSDEEVQALLEVVEEDEIGNYAEDPLRYIFVFKIQENNSSRNIGTIKGTFFELKEFLKIPEIQDKLKSITENIYIDIFQDDLNFVDYLKPKHTIKLNCE